MSRAADDETLLARFRDWLRDARAEAESLGDLDGEPAGADVGLSRLVEEFTALRHEVKLQTKGSRGLQEQAEALLSALQRSIDAFRSVQADEARAAWSAGKPLAEALADLDEALDRGRDQIERAIRRIDEEPTGHLMDALDDWFARQSWFHRLRHRAYHERVKEVLRERDPAPMRRDLLASLLEGYDLIRARLRRALQAEGIERIDCLGRPVDPERMTVVEVVDDPSRPPGEVVEETRRGYTWNGRLLRFAEVRAVVSRQ